MNKNKKISLIGISGKAGVGKDLVGGIIQYLIWKNKVEKGEKTNLHYTFKDFTNSKFGGNTLSNWEIKKFADKLKDIVCLLIGCTREQLEDREFKEKELGEEWDIKIITSMDGELHKIYNPSDYEDFDIKCKYPISYTSNIIKQTPRSLLQKIGTNLFRNQLHPNTWINATMSEYVTDEGYSYKVEKVNETQLKVVTEPEKYNNGYPNWIITDVRFPNELKAIKDRGGIIIRVNRLHNETLLHDIAIASAPFGVGSRMIEQNKSYNHPSETALDKAEFDYVIDNNSTIEELIEQVKKILIKEEII